jgi:hypothetical protein
MSDTFLTIRYKTGWIHSHYDRALRKECIQVQFQDLSTRNVRSVHAAKCAITRAK